MWWKTGKPATVIETWGGTEPQQIEMNEGIFTTYERRKIGVNSQHSKLKALIKRTNHHNPETSGDTSRHGVEISHI